MAELPYPISGKDITTALQQMQRLMDELYQNRLAGAELGDVFQIGDDDILALNLATDGGLEKANGQLKVLVDPDDALKLSADGVGINDATATKHGALPILSDDAATYLNGKGLWDKPAGLTAYETTMADAATYTLDALTEAMWGSIIVGDDADRAKFTVKSDGTVNLVIYSSNIVANANTAGKFCIGTSVANPIVLKNNRGLSQAVRLTLW